MFNLRRIRPIRQRIRSFSPQGSSFNPASLPGFVAEFNPSRSLATSNLWQNTAKTTPATANNDPVRVVVDPLSGIEWTAPSDAARGLLKISGAYSWIQFDGSDDQYDTGLTLVGLGATNSFSTGMAVNYSANSGNLRPLADWGSSNKSFAFGLTGTPSTGRMQLEVQSGTSAIASDPSQVATSTWYRQIGTCNAGSLSIIKNGSVVGTSTVTGNLNTGAGITAGTGRDGGRFNGLCSYIVIYTTALSAANLTLLDNYLRSLYP